MTTESGGGSPLSTMTRPLRKMGCGMDTVGCVGVGVVVGVRPAVVGVVVPVVVVGVVVVAGVVVPPPLLWLYAGATNSAPAANDVIAFTQTVLAIVPPGVLDLIIPPF